MPPFPKRPLVALAALVLALGTLYRPEIPIETLRRAYAAPGARFLEVGGMDVHVRDEGAGPPLLLIHGTAASLHTWDGWVEVLKDRFRLLRVDVPGFGLTGPDPTGDYTSQRRVEVLAAVLDGLGIDRCSVAGNSLGGALALELARSHPERVDRLVLIDPAGYPRRRAGGFALLDLARVPGLRWLFSRLTPRFLIAAGVREAYGDPSRVTPELVDRYYRLLRRSGNRRALLSGMTAERAIERAAIRSIRQPTLLLWGREDRLISVEQAPLFDRDLPNSELIVYDGIGHVPMEEIPERSAEDAARFLLAQRPPAAD